MRAEKCWSTEMTKFIKTLIKRSAKCLDTKITEKVQVTKFLKQFIGTRASFKEKFKKCLFHFYI